MAQLDNYSVYRRVIGRVLDDSERLPSLPSITLQVRQAMADEHATVEKLAQIITKDPALSALLLKAASSPIYKRQVAPTSLIEVIRLLGFANVDNMVMLHSMRSVFTMSSHQAKHLFAHTWRRLVVKISLANFFATKLNYRPVEQPQMAALLSELGSLAVLSALIEQSKLPDENTYFQMCKSYSKSLGNILLQKWNIELKLIDAVKDIGDWAGMKLSDEMELQDILNLALYYTVLMTDKKAQLPTLGSLTAFKKLPTSLQACVKENWLKIVVDNKKEIQAIVASFR